MKTSQLSINHLPSSIRKWLLVFIACLFISGITAFPIETQLRLAISLPPVMQLHPVLANWLQTIYLDVKETNTHYPYLAYGTDWLAFAHLVLCLVFIGPLRDPVRNIWVIEFGMMACVSIFPFALIAGPLRQIPFFWQLIDCSFGLFGGSMLWVIYRKIRHLEQLQNLG